MKFTAFTVSIGLLGLVGVLSPSHVAAASAAASSLTTSPAAINLIITPGSSNNTTLQVMNNTSQAFLVTTKVELFSAYGTSGQAKIAPAAVGDESVNWIHLAQPTFTAQPLVWTQDKLTINIPATASLGYYFAILFQPQTPISPTANQSTAIIKGSNAVLVLVDTHSNNEQRELSVPSFTVSQGLYEYLPATFNVTVHNDGNIYVAPQASIFVSHNDLFMSNIDTLDVNKGAGNVLPNSNRIFQAIWSNGFPYYQPKLVDGQPVYKNGKPVLQLQWNFTNLSSFRFGKYYAKLVLVYNNGVRDIPVTSVVSFWVVPWKLLLGLLVIVAIVLFGLYSMGRSIVRRIRSINIRRR
jgi:hypothetical protein